MNVDEVHTPVGRIVDGYEHLIDNDFHDEFDAALFDESVVDIVDPVPNINNPNMDVSETPAAHVAPGCPQRMMVAGHVKNFPRFFGEKTESAHNDLYAFEDSLEIQQIIVVVLYRSKPGLVILCLAKPSSGLTRLEVVHYFLMLQTAKHSKNSLTLWIIREKEQMASGETLSGNSNGTLDEFSCRFTKLGRVLGLNNKEIPDTIKLVSPSEDR